MSAQVEATWTIVGQGSVPGTEPHYLGMTPTSPARGHYYEVAGPDSDKVVAQVEFDDLDGADYFAPDLVPPVGLSVLARGNDGQFSETISGRVRLSFISDETFILQAARIGVAATATENPAELAVELEALMN